MTLVGARRFHLITALVAVVTLVVQLVLVVEGSAVLDETAAPPLGARVFQFFCYFTIQSNLLVALTCGLLAADPRRDGALFRVLRLDAVVGIAVTGVVHLLVLRPISHLTGLDWWVDLFLHAVVPLLAVVGWLAYGPRPRIAGRTIAWGLVWPIGWLVVTLLLGAVRDWYPYPFVNVGTLGLGRVLLNSLAVTVLFLLLFWVARLVDRRLPPAP